jgi:flavin-dependent dehydrogenase
MEGDRVTGVRCQNKGGAPFTEKAKLVIGADGRHSLVARTLQVAEYNTRPSMTCWYYTYWSNLPLDALMFYQQPNRAVGTIPTNDGQICIPVVWPHQEFHAFRSDIEGNYMKTFTLFPELNEMISQAKREERFVGMADVPGFFRKSYGPGWALVGDAGYHRDPMTGQGISDAFRGAEGLAEAIDAGFSGKEQLDIALERNERQRDASVTPMYDLTSEWASLQPPPPEMQQVLTALHGNQDQTNRFFGTAAGTVPVPEFFSEENIGKIMAGMGVNA